MAYILIHFGIQFSTTTNTSALADFDQKLSKHALTRENLLAIVINVPHINSDILKMQASALAKLSEATNELSRDFCVNNTGTLFSFI
jgi:hypothetical protein